MKSNSNRPISDIDLFSDDVLRDPYPFYRQLRDQAPAVWLKPTEMYALTRFEDVREALRNWQVFSSARGVAMNEEINQAIAGNTLGSDPPRHQHFRSILVRPLAPSAMREVIALIETEAEALVQRLVDKRQFNAATELAHHLPLTVVSHLVGLPDDGREQMLEWGNAAFETLGPDNARGLAARPIAMGLVEYAFTKIIPSELKPHSWAWSAFEAARVGEITENEARGLVLDYVAPSLDTTIFAITNAIWLFANNPQQWELVREDPTSIPSAINEVLRVESPIQAFSRYLTCDADVGGIFLPAGSRAIVVYGSANRDERKWQNPESFDVRRKAAEQLAFGHGEHLCVGLPLARLEMKSLFAALAKRVRRFEIRSAERALNNTLRGLKSLEVSVQPV
jgi:cytochrome P450